MLSRSVFDADKGLVCWNGRVDSHQLCGIDTGTNTEVVTSAVAL